MKQSGLKSAPFVGTYIRVERPVKGDKNWEAVRALIEMVPLDPRVKDAGRRVADYVDTPDEFLHRQANLNRFNAVEWADRYTFSIKLSVPGLIVGSIAVDDHEALEEFRRVIAHAIAHPLYQAETRRWKALARARYLESCNKLDACVASEEARLAAEISLSNYYAARACVSMAHRQLDGTTASHDEVLKTLWLMGRRLIASTQDKVVKHGTELMAA